jgi:hypothetical protein
MKTSKICSKCKVEKLASEFYIKQGTQLRNDCKKCFNSGVNNSSDKANRTRKFILASLGNKCSLCSHATGLEIDHIKGNGNKERLQYPNRSTYLMHIKKHLHTLDYQLLCKNCHTLKSNEENVHNPLRMAVIKLLGNQCCRCKFDNPGVLLVTSKSKVIDITNHFACDILINPTEYKLLCRNCY